MFCMAFSTIDLAMSAGGTAPLFIDTGVATTAGAQFDSGVKRNDQWLMGRVASDTAGKCLGGKVRLMTLRAGWDQAMFRVVAVVA